jgi:hypothetical protein
MNYMALNDRIGCCTIADKAHAVTSLEFYGQRQTVVVSDAEVLKAYSAVSGYDPRTGANDNGATLQDAYDYARKVGFVIDGKTYQLEAFAQLDAIYRRGNVDWDLIRVCIDAFSGVSVGMVFPDFAMDQFDTGQVWDWNGQRRYREEGGHDVLLVGYGGAGAGAYFDCWTWGRRQRMTLPFMQRFIEEYWTHGDADWRRADGTVPNGIDAAAANAEFQQLTGEAGPGWLGSDPAPTPDPAPSPDPAPTDADRALVAAQNAWRAAKGL